ncbi:MAG TPA: hypothetical protein PK400_12730 [Phycisphaerales bacterium]|nr:hypothetical protein [Phycisphaerales bacterium]HRQ76367.1 hypothetical protein [Phycisphaerales bacterium]
MPTRIITINNRMETLCHGFCRRSMLRGGIIAMCVAATWCTPAITRPASASTLAQDETTDPAQVVAAYFTARSWLDSFSPPLPDSPEARVPLDHASGVCVILRLTGRIVAMEPVVASDVPHRDHMIRRAMGRAMGQVLGDPSVASLPEDMRLEVGRSLTLELEVAGPLQPLLGRTIERLAEQIEPGIDGLAMRRSDSIAMAFPSQLRASNNEGQTTLRLPSLAAQLEVPPTELNAMLQQRAVTAHRFRTTHLAQLAPNRTPFETWRGDRTLPESEASMEGIAAFADQLALHTLASIWPGDERANDDAHRDTPLGVMGDYRPMQDVFRPLFAPSVEQALTSFALSRYAAAPGVHEAIRSRAMYGSLRLLIELEQLAPGEDDPLHDLAACAAIIYAVAAHPEARRSERIAQLMNGAANQVIASLRDGRVVDPRTGRAVVPHAQAMVIGAAAKLSRSNAELIDPLHVRAALNDLWRAVPAAEHVDLLPWVAWAEEDLAAPGEQLAHLEDLQRIVAALDAARLATSDAPPDARGGFVLRSQHDAAPRPTSQTARPAVFYAWALRMPDLMPENDHNAAIDRHRTTMRFLIQLSVRESFTWMLRSPERARGGVRASLWNHDLPRAAQAMALLAAAETLTSLTNAANQAE